MEGEYQNNIDKLREERNVCRERFSIITDDVEKILNSFAIDEGVTMITWKELAGLVMGEIYFVNEKVKFIKTFQDKNTMRFKTYMEAGGEFGLQQHDVLDKVFIEIGHLIEQERGNKIYEKGDSVVYAPKEKHKPKALVNSVYDVAFKKNKI